jgi:hypothetical protein
VRETKRYAFKVNEENDFDLIEHSNGEFVRYEDYARLKAEVARLTKAGDAIYQYFDQFGQVDATTLKEWQAAKGVKS